MHSLRVEKRLVHDKVSVVTMRDGQGWLLLISPALGPDEVERVVRLAFDVLTDIETERIPGYWLQRHRPAFPAQRVSGDSVTLAVP